MLMVWFATPLVSAQEAEKSAKIPVEEITVYDETAEEAETEPIDEILFDTSNKNRYKLHKPKNIKGENNAKKSADSSNQFNMKKEFKNTNTKIESSHKPITKNQSESSLLLSNTLVQSKYGLINIGSALNAKQKNAYESNSSLGIFSEYKFKRYQLKGQINNNNQFDGTAVTRTSPTYTVGGKVGITKDIYVGTSFTQKLEQSWNENKVSIEYAPTNKRFSLGVDASLVEEADKKNPRSKFGFYTRFDL